MLRRKTISAATGQFGQKILSLHLKPAQPTAPTTGGISEGNFISFVDKSDHAGYLNCN
jgi:hypothetical protein